MRYIYLLKDPITKEVVYVGETSNPSQRFDQHRWGTKSDCKEKIIWLSGLKAIGLKPVFEIVDSTDNKRSALIKENELIVMYLKSGTKLFNIKNITTLKQYNEYGQLVGEFTDCKRAFEITGIRPRVDRLTTCGFQWTYGEFSADLFGIKEAAKKVRCKPVLQIDKTGNTVAEFDGVRIACAQTGIDHRSISQVAAGSEKRKTAGGFYWKFKDQLS